MNLIRLLLLALGVWLLTRVIKRYMASAKRMRNETPRVGTMVRCAQCGLHVPEADAIKYRDRYFCCAEHRDEQSA